MTVPIKLLTDSQVKTAKPPRQIQFEFCPQTSLLKPTKLTSNKLT
jgi:hypothetical protein